MFSSDKNVETIAQLVEVLRHYIGLQTEYVKLDVIEKIVRLITVITLTVILSLLVLLILIYLSLDVAYALEPAVGTAGGFGIVAGIYLIFFLMFLAFRKKWIEQPLVRFLAGLLMEK